MAERDSTTIIEGEGQEGQPGGGYPLCEGCGEIARPGEKLCPMCQRAQAQEAAKQELIEKNTEPDYLDAMFSRAVASFKSLCVILDDAEYDIVLDVLKPLIEHLEADLTKIEETISTTLGHVKILVCTDPMRVNGKSYGVGDFYQAVLEPKEAAAGVQ